MRWLVFLALLLQEAEPNPPQTPSADGAAAPMAAETVESPSGGSADDAWMQEARDWLVAVRVAFDKMTPEQARALSQSFESLSPAALRVLVTVYEHTYGVVSPLSAADLRPPNETEAEREWIMAYRILYDRLTVQQAREYAETLKALNPNQVRALLQLYEAKNRQRIERQDRQTAGTSPGQPGAVPPEPSPGQTRTPDEEAAARRAFEQAQQRMQFEQEARQMALGRASNVRRETQIAVNSANASSAVTAAAMNDRLRTQEAFSRAQAMEHNAFQNQMYQRSIHPYGTGGWFRLY